MNEYNDMLDRSIFNKDGLNRYVFNPEELNTDIFNSDILELYKIYDIINKTNIIFDKINVIISEWFDYQLLNNSNKAINKINYLLPHTLVLINDLKDTVNIYYNIGNLVFNNISIIVYISGLLLITIFIIKISTCILLSIIYKKNIYKPKMKKLDVVNTRHDLINLRVCS